MPTTVVTLNTTLTSGTAYLFFPTLYAKNECGSMIGPSADDFIYPLPSTDVTTQCGTAVTMGNITSLQYTPAGQINYNYLQNLAPASVYKCMPQCGGGLPGWETMCPIIWDDYAPVLVPPPEITTLQTAWLEAGCIFDHLPLHLLNAGGGVLFDPPQALTPASIAAAPTPASTTWPTDSPIPAPAPFTTAIPTKTMGPSHKLAETSPKNWPTQWFPRVSIHAHATLHRHGSGHAHSHEPAHHSADESAI
ncbi:MAG: hypothetical protein M1822_003036 [Bathelium mastoideum]|nr:MAG: hypothetical protein M1822_003036 [Bathelium mastoideum]